MQKLKFLVKGMLFMFFLYAFNYLCGGEWTFAHGLAVLEIKIQNVSNCNLMFIIIFYQQIYAFCCLLRGHQKLVHNTFYQSVFSHADIIRIPACLWSAMLLDFEIY